MSLKSQAALELACRRYEAGDFAAAESACLEVVRKTPRNVTALQLLGAMRLGAGDAQSAAAYFAKALRYSPGSYVLLMALGEAQARLGLTDDALDSFRRADALQPDESDAQFNVAVVLESAGRHDEAVRAYEQIVTRSPAYHDAHVNLGIAYERLDRVAEAIRCYRNALAIVPQSVHALANLGKALRTVHELGAARAACLEALRIQPDFVDATINLAAVLAEEGDADAALREYEKAIALDPANSHARFSSSVLNLARGRFEEGWAGYLWRPTRLQGVAAGLRLERAVAEDLRGRSVLLLGEQGIGDELFFLRFAPALKVRGASVFVQCDAKLEALLTRTEVFDAVFTPERELPEADHVVAAGDLPLVLGHAGPEVPPPLRLHALKERVERVRRTLASLGSGPYIALTWRAGTPLALQKHRPDRALYKTVPIEVLVEALARVPGTLLALQRGPQPGEIENLADMLQRPVHDISAANDDLEEMLAWLAAIDDYVGVSSTNMHLIAGLGRPARVLVGNPPEWRWMWSGTTSPWFASFTVYREAPGADWRRASATLAADLERRFSPE